MILKAFRVQMYKNIINSGWIEIPQLTVVVGKNEAGKTSLLRALHKFNPFRPDPYIKSREWPRGRRREQSDDQIVCSTRLELSEEEQKELVASPTRS